MTALRGSFLDENGCFMREQSYQLPILTDAHDEDYNRHIRPSAMLRYMQMAANMQLHTYGPTTEDMLARGQAFILSAIDLTFFSPLSSYETIVSETWPCEARGFAMPRCYVLHSKNAAGDSGGKSGYPCLYRNGSSQNRHRFRSPR